MLRNISQEDLENRTVLEVGSGRGDTTRTLAGLLSRHSHTHLIVTDLSDRHFAAIRRDLRDCPVQVEFYQTGACDLGPVAPASVDYLVCNYTLCAINAHPGQLTLALHRFYQALNPGGVLYAEEEYPIEFAKGPAQEIWAEKWRILKAAMLIAGESPYQEIAPESLQDMSQLFGFAVCQWEAGTTTFEGPEVLQFFRVRLDRLLAGFPRPELIGGFRAWEEDVLRKYGQVGSMEVPYYRFRAVKR